MGTDIYPAPQWLDAPETLPVGEEPKDLDILKGQFLASLNHELRTPLSGVIGMTDLLAETTLHSEQREYVDAIRECASQLLEALNAVLDFSALSAGHTQALNAEFALTALLESIASDASARAEAKGLRVIRDWDSSLPESVIGDERYLRQILQHLVRNAVKFTIRGQITLSAGVAPGVAGGSLLVISVKDSGIGIAKDKLRVIFQAFRQLDTGLARSYSGLGLGLALSDKLVRVMGGEIEVQSSPGRGTTFTLHLPLTLPLQIAKRAPVAEGMRPRRPLVLVVEDDKISQRVAEHILERAEYDVIIAGNGESAIRLAASQAVDLILMDLQMPGIDGFQACRAIRELPGATGIPILALTANYSDEHRAMCKEFGMQGFLSKPVQREELLGALRTHLPAG